eukprot:s193_g5.t1
MEPSGLPRDTLLRILRMTAWRPDWGRASGVSKAWHTVMTNDVCYRAVRQTWIEDHDEDLQSTLRLIAAEDRRKKEKLREGRPGQSTLRLIAAEDRRKKEKLREGRPGSSDSE